MEKCNANVAENEATVEESRDAKEIIKNFFAAEWQWCK